MKLNEPTRDGYELGYQLAKFYERAEFKPERCRTCAFRVGTYANGSPQTVMDAMKCVLEGIPFYCHEESRLCGGYVSLRAESPSRIKAFWDFSDDQSGASLATELPRQEK